MFRKLNIRSLTIIFTVLLVVTVIVKVSDKKRGDRTLKDILIELKSDDVTIIKVFPKVLNGEQLTFNKQGNDWMVSEGAEAFRADTLMVNDIVRMFENLKPLRMAATKKDRWAAYEVTDSLATRIVFENDGDELAEVYVGKFSYRQPKNAMPQQNPYGRPQGTMNTYVRVGDEDEVYAVEGFLGMGINRAMSEFRDRTVINSSTELWNKMVFQYPADSSFTLIKQQGKWMMDGLLADSASVVEYLKPLNKLQSTQYSSVTMGTRTHSVRIEGEGMQPIEVNASLINSRYVITSSQNQGTLFDEAIDGNIITKLFVSKDLLVAE